MSIPTESYLEAFEREQFQTAAEDEDLAQRAEKGDALAHAFLLVARAHLDATHGDMGGATASFRRVKDLVAQEDGFKATALDQHADQCIEYLSAGKPLPGLPGGL